MTAEEAGPERSHPGCSVRRLQGIRGEWWVLDGEGEHEFVAAPLASWCEVEP